MNEPDFQSAAWYNATILTERIALLSNMSSGCCQRKINHKIAQQRIQKWKSTSSFNKSSCWSQRLAIEGITEDKLTQILGEPIQEIQNYFSTPPDWLTEIAEALTRPHLGSIPLSEESPDQEAAGFLNVFAPFINQARDRLHQQIQKLIPAYPNLPFDPNTVADLFLASLSERLLWTVSRTMILELNVARLQGLLQGDTQEERFQSFWQRLCQRDTLISLLEEYPVLARQIVIGTNQWVKFSQEFLEHLCHDWQTICDTFSPDKQPGLLQQIKGSLGDTHRGGHSVLTAEFESGLKLVYKPRSLAVDVHFQELLTWLNQRGNHPPFRILKLLNRGDYGWVEFVDAAGCTDTAEIQRFYERQGAYLGLLYAIEATDFHLENLIAAGEHPVLVDLESLFHPRPESLEATQSDLPTDQRMAYSVLRVGLLPERFWTNAESEGIEMSGLGGKAGQLTPSPVPYLEAVGTDEMRFARKRMPMLGSQNRPTLNGVEVNVLDYTESILTGFTNIYQLLLHYRDELLAENGLLACFAEDEVRCILRPTRTYSLLLSESFHPDFLRNALERDRFFDRLWAEIERHPYLVRVIAAEQRDLWQGDIPMFTTRPNSRTIWSSSNEPIADFFGETGMSLVQRRLQQLSEADLQQQRWFIRASLTTLAMADEQAQWTRYHLSEAKNPVSREQILIAAQQIGDRLEFLGLGEKQNVSWIGLTLIAQKHWILSPLGIDLYDGLAGIILFLAYLGNVTNQKRYTELAKAALKTMQHQMETQKASITAIGGYSGWGGIIYTLTHLGILWDEPELLAEAESRVELLPDLITKDEQFDIIGGAAGCLISLLNLYRCKPSQRTLAVAIQCGDRLITCAQPMNQGIGWVSTGVGKRPLTGFSHGAAGIALALLELSAMTGEQRFHKAALGAIAYERSLFSGKVGNWPDLREFEKTVLSDKKQIDIFMTAWCHGAPGVGLGRLRSLSYLDDSQIRVEIDTALNTTLTQGFGMNHCLCHGDLGNLELLLQASLILDHPQWKTQVNRLAAIILESINQQGWLCGVPLGVETPGLMTGLAGIGYELLRLAEPTRVPSVLALEHPLLNTIEQKSRFLTTV